MSLIVMRLLCGNPHGLFWAGGKSMDLLSFPTLYDLFQILRKPYR